MFPLLLEPAALNTALSEDASSLLLVDLGKAERFAQAHILGAQLVTPAETQAGPPVPGLLPDIEKLEQLLGRIGYAPDRHIVVYDDEGGGWAGRFIWILDEIGHQHYSYLNGGLTAWQAEGYALTDSPSPVTATRPTLTPNGQFSMTKQALLSSLEQVQVWDARSYGEYTGEKVNAARGGHIPGARHYEWTEAMDPARALKLKDLDSIRATLAERGIDGSRPLVTHCQSHHRSGLTYLLGKLLGYQNIRAYPGSWAEWGNDPHTPIVTGPQPD